MSGPVPRTPPRGRTDRPAGAALLLVGIAVAARTTTFDVAFLTDPVGPKALPGLSAAILLGAGLTLLARPGAPREWPSRGVLLRMGGAVAAFGLYALVLPTLGFALATTSAVGALSLLFGGPWKRSLAAAFVLSVVLWYLFVWVLGLPLPLGRVWEALWMR